MEWWGWLITVVAGLLTLYTAYEKIIYPWMQKHVYSEGNAERIKQIGINEKTLDKHEQRIKTLENGQEKIIGLVEKQNEKLDSFMKRSDENDKHIKEYLYDILNSLIHGNGKDKLIAKQEAIVKSMST